jgi:hypothetical protein
VKYGAGELEEAFAELLGDLVRVLDRVGAPWMLIGGLAVGAWTEPRGTKDCDLAIAIPEDVEQLAGALSEIGLVVFAGDLERAREGGAVRLRAERAAGPPLVVDLLCAGTAFETEALQRRTTATVLGVTLPVVSADHLLVYKLIAGRPQDLADIDKLVRFGKAPVDEPNVRRWAREWGVETRLDAALETARR